MNKKVVGLFSGCGGLDLGFHLSGYDILSSSDIMPIACETLKHNFGGKVIEGDITKENIKEEIVKSTNNKEIGVIIGGPPCQAYSISGKRDIFDKRGQLFNDYLDMVKRLKPRVCIMENVKGILSIKHIKENISNNDLNIVKDIYNKYKAALGEEKKELKKELEKYQEPLIKQVIRGFEKLGYNLKYKVLNSADYGVPQKRERVIFLAVRSDINIEIDFPKPIYTKDNYKSVQEAIDDLKNAEEDKIFGQIYTKHSDDFLTKIRKTPIGKSVLGSYSDAFFRNSPNLPSRTVKENHGGVFIHYEKDRVMTPRECARLQSFPDNFIIKGTKSQQLVQIGNAVPVGLAKAIGEHIKKYL